MIKLLSMDEAKAQLRIFPNNTDHDYDIEQKNAAASAIVMRHAKHESIPADWFDNNVSPPKLSPPDNIKEATRLVLSELFYNRESSISNPLSDTVKALIPRDPTLA